MDPTRVPDHPACALSAGADSYGFLLSAVRPQLPVLSPRELGG
jgi:hypothetical protein